jgi:ABC-type Fe3+ transport system substrate-binding protein
MLVSRDLRQLADLLAKGRLALILGVGYAVVRPFMEAGLPVKPLRAPNEGIHASSGFGTLTVMKSPPHPNATKVFVNWLLGKEGQEVYGRAMGSATRRLDVDTKWLESIGIQAAKDFLTVEEYLKRESFLEDRLELRKPPIDLAEKLIK